MTKLIDLEPRYAQIADEARQVAAALGPLAVEADASNELDARVHAALRESELMSLMVPAEFGGRYQAVDPFAVCLVREALMSVCSHADSLFALQGIGSYAITKGGTSEQRAEWLPRVASGEALAALALTEPGAGSDLKA